VSNNKNVTKRRNWMAKDLRYFLNNVKKDYPQGTITIGEEKGLLKAHECECTALLLKLGKMNKWPTAIFENVLTPSGEKWPGKIIFSELSSWPNVAVMLDLNPQKATVQEMAEVLHKRAQKPIPWNLIEKRDAPVKEVIWEGDKADQFKLPLYRKDSGDARPGWLSGLGVAKSLGTGRYNCSWHRHLVHNSKRSAARVNPRHLQEIMNEYKHAGYEEIPVAWIYGHHPIFLLAAAVQVGWDVDEYEFAGGLLGEPLRVVPSETLGEEFLVPADAEVVVEGFLHLTEKDMNGPWTDIMLYYSPQTLEPVFRPTVITMRRNPIFSESWIGYDLLPQVSEMAHISLALRQRYPRVKAVNSLAPYTIVIQFKPNVPGEAIRLAAYALGSFGDLCKNVIVVDEDIDPFDPAMVFYSIATRVDTNSSRLQIIKDLNANRQDPSGQGAASGQGDFSVGGLIIDSTKPVGRPFPEIGSPPDEVMEKLKIQDFVSMEDVNRIPSGRK
jgi:2,5-furandicarboxylate decarboxylase 1